MTQQLFAAMMKAFPVQKAKAEKVILKSGSKVKHAFLVIDGVIRVESKDRFGVGRRLISAQTGDLFPSGWLTFDNDNKGIIAEYDYIAHTDVVYLKLDKLEFEQYLKKHPSQAIDLLRYFDMRINFAKHRMDALIQERAVDKILHLLRYLAERFSIPMEQKNIVKITSRMTQQEIGESLGISRETTSITFRHLTEAGIIVQKGGKFIFLDKQKLNSRLIEKEAKTEQV